MRLPSVVFSALLLFLFTPHILAQQPPPRDPQAVAVLQQSVAAMGGGIMPRDSLAIGTVTIVEGSATESGTVRILTRGPDQTLEEIQTAKRQQKIVYSRGNAKQVEGTAGRSLPMELVVSSQCPDFPLALVAGALNSSDVAIEYLGREPLGGGVAHHIRFWKTFPNQPKLQHLGPLSAKDIWVDAVTGLVRKISYFRRAAMGASPAIPAEVVYSNYRGVSGVQYPFTIEKSFNGTPWMTIAIQSVTVNTGLRDADFPVR